MEPEESQAVMAIGNEAEGDEEAGVDDNGSCNGRSSGFAGSNEASADV